MGCPFPLVARFGLILGVIVAAAGCLALGWWQWTRFESTSGTFQNLGYALQWPMFAAFCVYAYRKFIRFEESPPEPPPTPMRSPRSRRACCRNGQPAPQSETQDATMREYNAYLADLADRTALTRPHDDQNRTTA